VRQLIQAGCILHRHGSRHDIYLNPGTGRKQPIPGYAEIDDTLVKHIKKYLGLARE